jgi:uncharacterized membrane protein YkoI
MKRQSVVFALVATLVSTAALAQAPKAATKPAKPKYHRTLPASLMKEARVTESVAADAAKAAVPGSTIDKVVLEKEDGKLIYSYDLKTAGKTGVDEVHVDAVTGAVISNVHETPAQEKAEKKAEKKEASKTRKPESKKPPVAEKKP